MTRSAIAFGLGLMLVLASPSIARSADPLPELPPPLPTTVPPPSSAAAPPARPPSSSSSPTRSSAAASANANANAPAGPGAWKSFRAGASLVSSVPTAAIIDGVYSITLHINTELTNRTWDAPYPWGTLGQYSTRILYGTTWTLMLGLESLAVVLGSKGKLDWMSEVAYRTEWLFPLDLPACPNPGAMGGCGVGVGGMSYLQMRPFGSRWWYEAGGGWIQQRVLNDALRTVAESTWVLTPLTIVREFKTDPERDVAFNAFMGPGVFFGMHAGHLHPTPRGQEIYDNVPWTEMYPLDAGVGPGGRIEGRLTIKQHLSFEGGVTLAPFLLGGPQARVSHDIAPLDFERQGWSVWRKFDTGIGWQDPNVFPFKLTFSYFGMELSERPIERIGYRGGMIRFDIPLKVPRE